MNRYDINCAHACKNSCAMLNKAIEFEAELSEFYTKLNEVCNYPDVRTFLEEFVIRHQRMIEDARGKLQQMEARGRILDDIISSFDPAGV